MRRDTHTRRRPAARRRILLAGWLAAGALILARAAEVQVAEGPEWREVALRQHRTSMEVPAPRGAIVDRDGVPLAVSHGTVRVGVAPHELEDADEAARLLSAALDLPARAARGYVASERRWVTVPGRYSPGVEEALGGIPGVYLQRELQRVHPHGALVQSLLGTVREGQGKGGVEQAFDEVLRGRPGREILARDSEGREIPGESYLVEVPRSGGEVELTIDLGLQEIAEEALREAIASTGARGGDLLITDPETGEVLAMVSLRDGRPTLSAVTTPYEPGSTIKPFTVAALLDTGLASLDDLVDGEDGHWTMAGRTVTDVHPHGVMTMADALRVSSNVGIAKLARALSPEQQYAALRDFGFGSLTGIDLPGETAGILRRPVQWSAQSPVSLAIGYEVAVTPIQMAMAYGALANGGRVMEPRLVRAVRRPDGRSERRGPEVVRRVVREGVTRAVTQVLRDVVEEGTGTAARLTTFEVAGKSGTSRAYGPAGYERGKYFSSFAGFFPVEDPQLVVFVKLERPQGSYYGGATAAPVTRATLEAILAARRPPLDRRALLEALRTSSESAPAGASLRFASLGGEGRSEGSGASRTVTTPGVEVPLPDLSGLSSRVAARRLHALGFRVLLERTGVVTGTRPRPGERIAPGDTVRIRTGPGVVLRPGDRRGEGFRVAGPADGETTDPGPEGRGDG